LFIVYFRVNFALELDY